MKSMSMNEVRRHVLYHERIETADGPDTTELTLTFQANGDVRLDGCYAGPNAKKAWGDWDHEFWMDVPASHAHEFLVLMAQSAFSRQSALTYARLREECIDKGIPMKEGHWT